MNDISRIGVVLNPNAIYMRDEKTPVAASRIKKAVVFVADNPPH
jgi:hypothetical protein